MDLASVYIRVYPWFNNLPPAQWCSNRSFRSLLSIHDRHPHSPERRPFLLRELPV